MTLFALKKLLGTLLMPLPLLLAVILTGLLLMWRNRAGGLTVSSIGFLLLYLVSTPFVADSLLSDRESRFAQFNASAHPHIDTIVVLGCDLRVNPALSANAQLGSCALPRLVEGVRLANLYPHAGLVLTGAGHNGASNASLMKGTALSLGIAKERITTLPSARDTAMEAKLLGPMLVDLKVVLVTSAAHMTRAKDLFNAQGITVIPAPTDFFSLSSLSGYRRYLPNLNALSAVTQNWHEILGSRWVWLRRTLDPEAL